jgi:HEAT repeat protein
MPSQASPELPPELQQLLEEVPRRRRPALRSALGLWLQQGINCLAALPATLAALPEADRSAALGVLEQLWRRRAVTVLLGLLPSDDVSLRASVVEALGRVGGERAFQALLRAMQEDPDATVREMAAYVLTGSGDDRTYEPMVAALQETAEAVPVRTQAAEALGELLWAADHRNKRVRRAARALIHALRDPAPEVRFWSAFALGTMRTRAALPELRRLAAADTAMCPGWWPVQDEARDAIQNIRTGVWPRCDLSGKDLRGADLRGRDLHNADLVRSDLRGADLRGAKLYRADLVGAAYDDATRWPEGFDPEAHGAQRGAPGRPSTVRAGTNIIRVTTQGTVDPTFRWRASDHGLGQD